MEQEASLEQDKNIRISGKYGLDTKWKKNLPATYILFFLELFLWIASSSRHCALFATVGIEVWYLVLVGAMNESVGKQRLDTEVVVCDVSQNMEIRTVAELKLSDWKGKKKHITNEYFYEIIYSEA